MLESYAEEAVNKIEGKEAFSLDVIEDNNSIKKQLISASEVLDKMDLVGSINVSNHHFNNIREIRAWVLDEIKKYGHSVDRIDSGIIEFTDKDITSALGYIHPTDSEVYALPLVPKVLKRGVKIGEHINHKGREYSTVTYAAPVEINGVRGNMAVVAKTTNRTYYKMHKIVTPDGRVFVVDFEQKKSESARDEGVTNNGSLAHQNNSDLTSMITNDVTDVNEAFSLDEDNFDAAVREMMELGESVTKSEYRLAEALMQVLRMYKYLQGRVEAIKKAQDCGHENPAS